MDVQLLLKKVREPAKLATIRRQDYGMNELHFLAFHHDTKKLAKLAEKKPELLKGKDQFGRTPLMVALQCNNIKAVRILNKITNRD